MAFLISIIALIMYPNVQSVSIIILLHTNNLMMNHIILHLFCMLSGCGFLLCFFYVAGIEYCHSLTFNSIHSFNLKLKKKQSPTFFYI